MFTEKLYLKSLKVLLPLFVLSLPLANRDIFSLYFNRLFPARLIFLLLILSTLSYYSLAFGQAANKRQFLVSLGQDFYRDFVFKLLTALWLVRLISLKNSLNLTASLSLLSFYSSVVVLYVIFKFLYRHQTDFLERLFKLHLITVSLTVLYGFLQMVLAFFGWRLPGVLVGSAFVRIPATFYDANHLPPYLLTAFPTLFIYFFYLKKDGARFFLGILLFLYTLVTLFTFSRSGFLSMVVAFLILSWFLVKKRCWQKVSVILAVAAFAFLVAFLTAQTQLSLVKRLTSVFNLEDKSTVAHGLLIYGSLALIRESPVIGLGYGSFSEHFRSSSLGQLHSFFDLATNIRLPAHSLWLEVLVETGLLGFALYLWLFLDILEKGFWSLKSLKIKRFYLEQLALVSSLVGILAGGLFYSYNLEFFWFFVFFLYFRGRGVLSGLWPQPYFEDEGFKDQESAGEEINLKLLFYWAAALAVAVSVIFSGLGLIPVRPGLEGLYGTVGKDIRREWGYNSPAWWWPKYAGRVVTNPPLLFWLNAFWTFLYDFGERVIRFWPALAGLLSVAVVFFASLKGGGKGRLASPAFFSALVLLGSPFFLDTVRRGTPAALVIFFSGLIFYLARLILLSKKIFLVWPLFFSLVLLSLVDYRGFLFLGFLYLLYFLHSSLVAKKAPIYLPGLVLFSALPLILWSLAFRPLGLTGFYAEPRYYVFPPNLKPTLYYLLLVPLVVYLAPKIYRHRGRALLWVLTGLILGQFFKAALPKSTPALSKLIKLRHDINRDGRVPLYLYQTPASDSFYYSEVPLLHLEIEGFRNILRSDDPFFAIFPGDILRQLRAEKTGSFRVEGVVGELVLIEKPGKVK